MKSLNQKHSGQSGTDEFLYYAFTFLMFILWPDRSYRTNAKGFRLYMRRCKRVLKQFLANLLCVIFKYIFKYRTTK